MRQVRLWSFQSASIEPTLAAGRRHIAQSLPVGHNFRFAYDWMTERLTAALGTPLDSPPVWCWHSCEGRWRRRPTVGTATALLGDYALREPHVRLELTVPVNLMLLSSYSAWNRLLDTTIVRSRPLRSHRWAQYVFARPYLRDEGDNVQAVIPWIEPNWIRSMQPLVIRDRNWHEPV